ELDCDLVLLALGFLGPETDTIVSQLSCELTERGNLKAGPDYQTTVPGVFACGDARRGQSLVVWAIWEGREAARGVDAYLIGEPREPSPRAPVPSGRRAGRASSTRDHAACDAANMREQCRQGDARLRPTQPRGRPARERAPLSGSAPRPTPSRDPGGRRSASPRPTPR